jgi:hypothetical protein
MGHKLCQSCQYLPICRLVAAAMRRAQEDETKRRILDGLVSWLQPCLQESLRPRSIIGLCLPEKPFITDTCFTTIPPREWAMNMRGRWIS